jgi:hypothetical protein
MTVPPRRNFGKTAQAMGESTTSPSDDPTYGRFCPACGYNLRGINSDRCPECGHAVDPTSLAISVIPWTHRRSLGRMAAYVRTVKMSIMHSRKLSQEIARPTNFADAILFRRVTAVVATVSLIVLSICLALVGGLTGDLSSYRLEIVCILFFWICIWFFFLTSGGVASYWFHPRSRPILQQNRAIAISYYSCGPLALTPIAVLMICSAAIAGHIADQSSQQWSVGAVDMIAALAIGGIGLLISEFALMLLSATRMLGHATHCSAARSACCWIGLPVAWVTLAGVFLIALPAACVSIILMFLSFH